MTSVQKTKQSLTFVTGNKNKVAEVKAILGEELFSVDNVALDLPELQGGDGKEIAIAKAKLAFEQVGRPCVVEDSSLGFNAHKGLPGPYVKWYLDSIGAEGLYKTLVGFEDKTGYASCIFALCRGPDDVVCFEGRVDGTIVAPRGDGGFGWDPLFQPHEGDGRTFGEYTKEEKNAFSHRKRALGEVKAHFEKLWREVPAVESREPTASSRKRDRDEKDDEKHD